LNFCFAPKAADSTLAQQRFSAVFREALRNAHGDKCIYCGRHLLFRETKVDHVLPESCSKNEDEAKELRQRFGLPDSFDILGHENLAPSCESCNGQKSDLLFKPGYIAIVLANIEKKIPKLHALLEERQAEVSLDKILRMIVVAVERRSFSKNALVKAIDDFAREPPTEAGVGPSEERNEMFFALERQILIPRHALIRSTERGIDLARLVYEIRVALRHGTARVNRLQNTPDYEFRGSDNIRVVFRVDEKAVTIKKVYRKTHCRDWGPDR
jgi:hypothetical protein